MKKNKNWIIKITFLTFIISIIFNFCSEMIISHVDLVVSILVLVFFILLGIIFDVIGVAATACDEKHFHSMASKRISGAKIAISMKKKSAEVSSFCNDVIGDICGIITGGLSVSIAIKVANLLSCDLVIVSLLVTGCVASLTIGGKAFGKTIAVNKSTEIMMETSKFLSFFIKR